MAKAVGASEDGEVNVESEKKSEVKKSDSWITDFFNRVNERNPLLFPSR
jgi:hypothetical protein